MRRAAPLLALFAVQALVGAQATAGVRADGVAAVPNADFDAGLTSWSQASALGGSVFQPASGPLGETSVRVVLPSPGVGARLWQTLQVTGSGGAVVAPSSRVCCLHGFDRHRDS